MPWDLTGNAGTNPNNNFVGTTDQKDLVVRTNNKEELRVTANGRVGIGTPTPQNQLHVGPGSSSIAASRVNEVVASNNPDAGIAIAQNSGVNVLLQASTAGGYLGTTSNHPLVLRANDQDSVVVNNDGRVGVGVSASFLDSTISKMVVGGSPIGPTTASNQLVVLGATVSGRASSQIILDPDLATIFVIASGFPTMEYGLNGVGSVGPITINAGGTGLIVNSNMTVKGFAQFPGGKQGFLVDEFLNGSEAVLQRGDLLTLQRTEPKEKVGDRTPIPHVELASEEYAVRVCGIVEGAVPKPDHAHKDGISIEVAPGAHGLMVTIGCYAECKVDADIASIEVGDLLTTSSTPGHAQKVLDRSRAVGAIVGKALKAIEKGKATIPILVLLH